VNAATARLKLRVAPGSRRAAVVGRYGDAWKVAVTQAPERDRANAAVLSLLAKALGLAAEDVRLIRGGASRDKVVEVRGLDAQEAERRLARGGSV
jgi:uncharacterized protein YggU (UPF0235/DUF167 family)